VHTYGLEKSFGVELGWSYVKPLFRSIGRDRAQIEDEFHFDLSPLAEASAAEPANPLRAAVPRRTNVVLVSLESVAQPYLERSPRPMPFLRGFGERAGGVYSSEAHAVWPQTMKAFFATFCSELPHPTYRPITLTNPAIPCRSLTEVLRDEGYYNALITTADLAYDRKLRFFRHRAFDKFLDMRNMPGRERVWGDSWGLDEKIGVENILALAREKRDERFFVFYEMFTAHHPYHACQEHEDNPLGDDFEQYLRALRYIDDRLRDLVQGLEDLGLADETLVVVFSDHGEGFGQHPGSQSHGPKVYQENIQIPLAFHGPQLADVAGEVSFPVSQIDIAPTILGLLGIDIPCTMKGRDLTAESGQRLVLFGGRPPGAQMGIRDGKWKYIIDEDGPEYLFDMHADPGEERNLIGAESALAARYEQRIQDWIAYSGNLIERYTEILGESSCDPHRRRSP
jgi:phosphoglycerol transferase MdoB-like AlkP superfamily enzyme